MKQELAKMNDKLSQREKAMERKEQLTEIRTFLNSNKDEYEFTYLHNYAPKVQELMDYYYENEKKILSYPEAAKAIEIELEKYERQKAETISKSKKGKEVYRDIFKGTDPLIAKAAAKIDPTLKTEADVEQVTAKPRPVTPITKKPVLKHQSVMGPGAKEVEGTFRDPAKKGGTKQEVMAKIIAQFS